LIILALFWWSC